MKKGEFFFNGILYSVPLWVEVALLTRELAILIDCATWDSNHNSALKCQQGERIHIVLFVDQ